MIHNLTPREAMMEIKLEKLAKERDDLREALHAMMSAVLAFQHEDARRPDYLGNPYYCPSPPQGKALLKAYDLASVARANSPLANLNKPASGE